MLFKGTDVAPSEFNIMAYSQNGTNNSGGVEFDYNAIFPKYTQVKYAVKTSATNLSSWITNRNTSTNFTLSTAWQTIPSSIKSGSGNIRFTINTSGTGVTPIITIYLK